MYKSARYLWVGDSAILVEFGDDVCEETNTRVRSFALAVRQRGLTGITEVVPTYRSVLVYYDPLGVAPELLTASLEELEHSLDALVLPRPRLVFVPTVYGGSCGPDLPFVARHNDLTEEEVVRIHSSADYRVYMIGFTPGFPYLGGMSTRIATPRLESPRKLIPAGSVGIGGSQTGIYSVEAPGGWRLIGRTPLRLFDPARENGSLLRAGDHVRFEAVPEEEFAEIRRGVEQGSYTVRTRER